MNFLRAAAVAVVTWAALTGGARVTKGLLAEYDFLRADCLSATGVLPNTAATTSSARLPSLQRTVTSGAPVCLVSNGVSSRTKYATAAAINGFMTRLGASNNFTVELWYETNASTNAVTGFKHEMVAAAYPAAGKCPYYVQLSETSLLSSLPGTPPPSLTPTLPNHIHVTILLSCTPFFAAGSTVLASFCNTNLGITNLYMPTALVPGRVNHVVASVAYRSVAYSAQLSYNTVAVNFTLNGVAVGAALDGTITARYDASTWSPATVLRLFGAAADLPGGNVRLLAVYDGTLTHAQVRGRLVSPLRGPTLDRTKALSH